MKLSGAAKDLVKLVFGNDLLGSVGKQLDSQLRPFLTDYDCTNGSQSFRQLKLFTYLCRLELIIGGNPRSTKRIRQLNRIFATRFVRHDDEGVKAFREDLVHARFCVWQLTQKVSKGYVSDRKTSRRKIYSAVADSGKELIITSPSGERSVLFFPIKKLKYQPR